MSAGGVTARTALLTSAAMLAFAGNSLLCRLALKSDAIDPASFTALRLVAGTLMLLFVIQRRRQRLSPRRDGSWVSALMLFAYAAAFSFAYVSLEAAGGALLLFGFVQATMLAAAFVRGERPRHREWLGWAVAAAGLCALLLPGADAPAAGGALLMALAGIAWGVYSLRGQRAAAALASTAANFLLAALFVPLLMILVLLPATGDIDVGLAGAALAVTSGAVTSGLGYVLWYAALRGLTALQAALVQLSVPPLTAAGGILLLGEPLTPRLLATGALILGGIAVALTGRRRAGEASAP